MKPPLCICDGPLESKRPGTYSFEIDGQWYEGRDICPIHGPKMRLAYDLASVIRNGTAVVEQRKRELGL